MEKNRIKELLEHQNNTRNFEHLRTCNGKHIRTDIIRSNILTREQQVTPFISKSLNTIIDLRIEEEGGGEANTNFSNTTVIALPILFGNLDPKKIVEWLMLGELDKIDSFLEGGYLDFTSCFKPQIQQFFSIIADEENLPLAFHCSAGKDRTGALSALFLLALGVAKEDVIADYMETNNRIAIEETAIKIAEDFEHNPDMTLPHPKKSKEALKMLLGVKLRWIEMFLEGINKNFGGIDHYLTQELHIDVNQLQGLYLID